jgi:hypothetical protein
MTSIHRRSAWLLALATPASAREARYVVFSRTVSATGTDRPEAALRLQRKVQELVARLDVAPRTLMGSRVVTHHLTDVRREDDAATRCRLVGAARFLVFGGRPSHAPRRGGPERTASGAPPQRSGGDRAPGEGRSLRSPRAARQPARGRPVRLPTPAGD